MREPSPNIFIPGTKILRPVIDVVSKRLLEHNKEALVSLLTAVLSPHSPIKDVSILNPEMRNGPSYDDKLSRLDMLVRLDDGHLINIEFQTGNHVHFVRRALFYLFQMGIGELRAGEDYGRLPNLTGIYIFDDVFRDDVPDVHLVYEPTRVNPRDGAYLQQGLLRMDFIQLPKFSALNPAENQLLSAWVQLFGAKSAEDLESAASETPVLSNLVRSLKAMSSNPELIDLAEKRRIEKIIEKRARFGEMEDAKEEARKTGLAEGRAEGQTQATLAAVQKVLIKRLRLSPETASSQLSSLTAKQLEALLDAALDFETPADFESWLKKNG
ncbi:MAG: Rpn family recombination-promoting nuclease/putative transposase [Proteobacteria bacterium]|nr:Rpn family recombination-promoting nuclease/putative transposase [Pseudomonadota bacterium]